MRSVLFMFFVPLIVLVSNRAFAQMQNNASSTRGVVGYMSVLLPVLSVDNKTTTTNFSKNTIICFPIGINALYSDKFGFSFEITPTLKINDTSSKISNFLFDPGLMFRFKNGFTIIPRLAFETSGRYGITQVFNKIIKRTKLLNYFAATSIPFRLGNSSPSSVGLNVQFGFIFN